MCATTYAYTNTYSLTYAHTNTYGLTYAYTDTYADTNPTATAHHYRAQRWRSLVDGKRPRDQVGRH